MGVLRVSVVLVTIASLLVLMYYTALELLAVWRAMTTLTYQPFTALSEQSAYMLLFDTIAYSLLVVLLLIAITAVLHFARRLS
jgi:uncharacterized membrane protein